MSQAIRRLGRRVLVVLLAALATSIADSARVPVAVSIDHVLNAFLTRFESRLRDLATDRPSLVELWNAYDLLRDLPVRVRQGDHVVEGVGAGIDAHGGLVLAANEERKTVYGGTVERTNT